MVELKRTQWYGFSAWVLESEAIKAIIVPELGAKIGSLFDKRAGFEWLVSPLRTPKSLTYGASFTEQDMSAWDEMFPSIEACQYPAAGEYSGRVIPDHGEVWSLPWIERSSEDQCLTLSVEGRALPYQLTRKTSFSAPTALCLEYTLEFLDHGAMYYLWAAHPQFAADLDTIIKLPNKTDQVVNVLKSHTWGEPGTMHAWPTAIAQDGSTRLMDKVGPATRKDCRKFYLPTDQRANWVALENPQKGCSLRLEWSVDDLPYLGLWVDEGAYHRLPVVALEPSNGFYDSLALAYQNRRVGCIHAGEKQSWSLTVQFSDQGSLIGDDSNS